MRPACRCPTTNVRGQALQWLARHASAQAGPAIADAIERDPELDVKRRAVMALGQMPRDEGVPLLIDVARTHESTEVRRRAMQTLGQTNDPRAVAFFEQILLSRLRVFKSGRVSRSSTPETPATAEGFRDP